MCVCVCVCLTLEEEEKLSSPHYFGKKDIVSGCGFCTKYNRPLPLCRPSVLGQASIISSINHRCP